MANNAEGLSLCMFGLKRFGREGGVEVVVEELSTRMVKLGHQVTCYTRGGHHVSGKEFDGERLHEYKGVKLKTVPTINGKGLAAVSSSFFAALASAADTMSCTSTRRPGGYVLASKVIWKTGCSDSAWGLLKTEEENEHS